MSSRGGEIAEALRVAFAASFAATPKRVSQDIVVSRVYYQVTKKLISEQPLFDHSAFVAGSVRVYLMAMPESASQDDGTRDRVFVNYPIQVGIAAYLANTSTANIDPLMQVSQELRDYCLKMPVTNPAYSLGIPEGVTQPPQIGCDPDFKAIQTDKLFLSVFQLVFEGARGL